jgi:polar amino acid transport system substrate-binding protein
MGSSEAAAAVRMSRLFVPSTVTHVAEIAIGGIVFILVLQAVLQFSLFDASFRDRYDAFFIPGLYGSLRSIFFVMPISLVVGFFAGWARISRFRILSWPATLYVDFFRGVPPLVLVIFAFLFGTSFIPGPIQERFLAGMSLQSISVTMAAVAIALHSGAYQAEIFRAGFQSVPRGQQEAAQALGMRPWQAMRFVILPQTFRLSLPPLGNELAVLIKDTSLLAIIAGGAELVGGSQNFVGTLASRGLPLEWMFAVWTVVAVVYFVMTFIVTRVLLVLERRFRALGFEAVSI